MIGLATVFCFPARADDSSSWQRQLEQLQQQNAKLQSQLREQQELIAQLAKQVAEIKSVAPAKPVTQNESETTSPKGFNLGKVHISGEGAVGFFRTGSEGFAPNGEFRVDEAKLFVEAPVWKDVYFFSELNLFTREDTDLNLQLGELYLDFENVSQLWQQDGQLNLRLGRFDIPFGEEYLSRDAIDDPLISHSLMDFWGVDEGVEVYGAIAKLQYVLAVQSGGASSARDFTADKSVTLRLSGDPISWLHVGASAMRTGDVDVMNEGWSELWFGGGWFGPISPSATQVHANLAQGDVTFRLPCGHVKLSGGYARYGDNDPSADNGRDIWFYSVEGLHRFTRKFYAAARFSQILAERGYLLVGNGDINRFYFDPTQPLTDNLWQLSLGLGYRFCDQLVVKAEYTFERGHQVNGEHREHEDSFAAQVAFKF
ncbi:MAG: hypothetical protein EPO07_04560 [Verrucomicrobia bacterium]|nr:MAG: hypothetical protein EPO07_04560 [Verrucomicrobiota bacterium]